jgi:hypothetical protein
MNPKPTWAEAATAPSAAAIVRGGRLNARLQQQRRAIPGGQQQRGLVRGVFCGFVRWLTINLPTKCYNKKDYISQKR